METQKTVQQQVAEIITLTTKKRLPELVNYRDRINNQQMTLVNSDKFAEKLTSDNQNVFLMLMISALGGLYSRNQEEYLSYNSKIASELMNINKAQAKVLFSMLTNNKEDYYEVLVIRLAYKMYQLTKIIVKNYLMYIETDDSKGGTIVRRGVDKKTLDDLKLILRGDFK